MKIGNPPSRYRVVIGKNEKVLEVGGGSNPHPRANIVTDKFIDSNYHRDNDIRLYPHQKFMAADGNKLPFKDKEFDYVFCNHVLEHVDDPIQFVSELSRVAKRGYLETPSLIGEHLHPKESHRWVLLEIDNKVVMYEKEKIDFQLSLDLGGIFLEEFLINSFTYRVFDGTYPNLRRVMYEWKDDIEILINPSDEYYRNHFTNWSREITKKILPLKGTKKEILMASGFVLNLFTQKAKGILSRKKLDTPKKSQFLSRE